MFITWDFVARCALFGFVIVAFVFAAYYLINVANDFHDDLWRAEMRERWTKFLDDKRNNG